LGEDTIIYTILYGGYILLINTDTIANNTNN